MWTTDYVCFISVLIQTGPKGVINDWRRFKQLETEKRAEQETERLQLAEKLTLTCRTAVRPIVILSISYSFSHFNSSQFYTFSLFPFVTVSVSSV